MTQPSNLQTPGRALGSRSRDVDLLCWCGPDMDDRIPGMEAFVTPEPDHLQELIIQPAECTIYEDAAAGAAARRLGDLEPRAGRAGQARALLRAGCGRRRFRPR